jgi:hypothetical protein
MIDYTCGGTIDVQNVNLNLSEELFANNLVLSCLTLDIGHIFVFEEVPERVTCDSTPILAPDLLLSNN